MKRLKIWFNLNLDVEKNVNFNITLTNLRVEIIY